MAEVQLELRINLSGQELLFSLHKEEYLLQFTLLNRPLFWFEWSERSTSNKISRTVPCTKQKQPFPIQSYQFFGIRFCCKQLSLVFQVVTPRCQCCTKGKRIGWSGRPVNHPTNLRPKGAMVIDVLVKKQVGLGSWDVLGSSQLTLGLSGEQHPVWCWYLFLKWSLGVMAWFHSWCPPTIATSGHLARWKPCFS